MKNTFNRLYENLASGGSNWSNESEIAFKKSLILPIRDKRTLALVGCGDFALGFHLQNEFDKILGTDFSDRALSKARSHKDFNPEKMELVEADLSQPWKMESKWELVVDDYISHCIVTNRPTYYDNIKKLMAPNALFVTLALCWPEDFKWTGPGSDLLDFATKSQKDNEGNIVRKLLPPKDLLQELKDNSLNTLFSQIIVNPTGQPIFFSINQSAQE